MMSPARAASMSIGLAAFVCLTPLLDGNAAAGDGSAAASGERPSGESGPSEERFYLRLGARGLDFDLELDDRITPVTDDYRYAKNRTGVDLAIGYDFGPRFGLEADIGATTLAPSPEEAEAFLANTMLIGLVPIFRCGAHEVRIAGGIGTTMLYQNGPDFPERVYLGTAGLVGARLRLQAGRHVRLSMGADYTVQDTRWEILPNRGADDEVRNVGGTAWIRSGFAGLEFCF